MTSVKEFRVDEPATADGLGRGRFVFTDAYSVFDWGQMPDAIPNKGASLCAMGAFNFELLEREGVPTHYRGVTDPAAEETTDAGNDETDAPAVVPLDEATAPPTKMAIDLTRVPDLPYEGPHAGYDYDAFHAAGGPAEFGLDSALGVDEWPDEPVDLPEPVVEFSTKYERQDRYLTRVEADEIAGAADIDALESLARDVNRVVTERADTAGFVHEDGKIECLYADGELRVADVVGTFDENRFSYGGRSVSKEVVRQWYKANDPDWVAAVKEAKTVVADRDTDDWRALCEPDPVSLPPEVVDEASDLYAAGTNAYTDRDWFDAPDIEAALDAIDDL
ncbi:phosphoribosylaminoimidazolesuccinocarboxamide synthase [Halobacteriales archaeon SW_8_68_21]|nr:MAG: phosphoribosylaminoimidazolesuccinocarboxamide synthase [Halobacteriales archaeon SW_8_68_21]